MGVGGSLQLLIEVFSFVFAWLSTKPVSKLKQLERLLWKSWMTINDDRAVGMRPSILRGGGGGGGGGWVEELLKKAKYIFESQTFDSRAPKVGERVAINIFWSALGFQMNNFPRFSFLNGFPNWAGIWYPHSPPPPPPPHSLSTSKGVASMQVTKFHWQCSICEQKRTLNWYQTY